MYRHPKTAEGEYPRTVREVLHHSIDMLAQQFPERVVAYHAKPEHFHQFYSASGYSWPGAGSEKGGSAEHIAYERVLFLPERAGRVQAVSVGDRQYDFSNSILIMDDGELSEYRPQREYSVLFQLGVSPGFAERLLGYYHEKVKAVETWNISFTVAVDRLLEDGTNHFGSVPLFAFDPKETSDFYGKFSLNRHGVVIDSRDLEGFSGAWDWYLGGSHAQRTKVSRYVADHLLGEEGEETFRDKRFIHPQRRVLQDLQERDEKRILESLHF
ncbi:hypothetical protein HZA98_02915 [Candidatus Woesearchaeota archaeon]|nr:hypothetical protein [Candidatus Woesearchaeota archaeon]